MTKEALAQFNFKLIFKYLKSLRLTDITLENCIKKERELTHIKYMHPFFIPISVCAVFSLFLLFLSSHSYQLKSLPLLFQLNILLRKQFIFVSQTFFGWGLLGNGCMKDVSRARRDVWLWKGYKNSQTPNIALLLYII